METCLVNGVYTLLEYRSQGYCCVVTVVSPVNTRRVMEVCLLYVARDPREPLLHHYFKSHLIYKMSLNHTLLPCVVNITLRGNLEDIH